MKVRNNGKQPLHAEKKSFQPTVIYPEKLSFKNEGETKAFSDKQKWRVYYPKIPTEKIS